MKQIILFALPDEGVLPDRGGGLLSLRRIFPEIPDADVVAPTTIIGVVYHGSGRHYRLAVLGCISVGWENSFRHFRHVEWGDRSETLVTKIAEYRW